MKEVQNEQLFQELDNEVAATCSGGSAFLYEDDFLNAGTRGRRLQFNIGTDDLRIYNFNDKTSSIFINSGETWRVYQDINKGGRSVLLGSGSYYLSDLRARGIENDWISSLRRIS